MRKLLFISSLALLSVLTGCVEIIDDLTLNLDGSGNFKYNLNLSSSKVKINSLLALDSLDGRKVPSLPEIKAKVARIETQLDAQTGISNVKIDADYDNFIFKLSCDFSSLSELQGAVKKVIISENSNKPIPELDFNWLIFEDNKLERSVPELTIKKSNEINEADRDLLKKGTYMSITRFEGEIEKYNNEKAVLSANKKAVMIRTDPYSLAQNPRLLDNVIYLRNSKD